MAEDGGDLLARVMTWMSSNDTGLSSKAIATHMSGGRLGDGHRYPHDPADLGRCLRLLVLFPEWAPRINEMAAYGPGWAGIANAWDQLSTSMRDEVGIDWSKGRSAPKTYRLMKDAIAAGYRADPRFDCTFNEHGHLSSAHYKYRRPDAAA